MSLLALQRDFRCWLTAESTDAASRLEAGEAPGLSVYLNNYRSSLMGCLVESFPVTRAWIGEEGFAAACAGHIDRVPPRSWTLDDYALGLPETLKAIYPADPDVADLARIELSLGIAFVGADAEPIDPASLSDVDWEAAMFRFLPTLRLIAVTTNAAAICSAIIADEQAPPVDTLSEPACIAIWRHELTSAFRTLGEDETEALRLMMDGGSFGARCALLVDRHGEEIGTPLAGSLLGQWLIDGFITNHASVPSASCSSP